MLNDVDERKGFDYLSGAYIRHSFKNHITKYRRLGTYTDPNGEKIDVLVVQLKNEWALERSRTMLRNFTSDYLKNRDEKDGEPTLKLIGNVESINVIAEKEKIVHDDPYVFRPGQVAKKYNRISKKLFGFNLNICNVGDTIKCENQ